VDGLEIGPTDVVVELDPVAELAPHDDLSR
jgi:hypothetical protein